MKTISITDKAIRIKMDFYYKQIEKTNKDIEALRDSCRHSEKKRVTYEFAAGHTLDNTLVCVNCDKVLMTQEDIYWKQYLEE